MVQSDANLAFNKKINPQNKKQETQKKTQNSKKLKTHPPTLDPASKHSIRNGRYTPETFKYDAPINAQTVQ
jgi:hypothetical protein